MATVQLGSKGVGSIVKLKVNGFARNFIVVHQGKPSSVYDDSCNGTWLLMQDIYENRQWHSSNVNDYANSDIHSYLNSTFLAKFDSNIQKAIKQVKIPYRKGRGTSTFVSSGSNGLPAKVFLLSATETSFSVRYVPKEEGGELAYFKGCADHDADPKRIANFNGSANYWWLRTPDCYEDNDSVNIISTEGSFGSTVPASSKSWCGVRPALILPTNLCVSDDGTISVNVAPSTPGSISIPSSIDGGSTITISWAASSDANENLSGYILERSTDGGGSWSQIYNGGATSITNNVAYGTGSVMYRVKAYDSYGLTSGYRTSSKVTVFNNVAPTMPSSITVPEKVKGGESLTVSWGSSTDSNGNLSGYILERSVNGGSFSQLYKGSALRYTDTITKGWNTVAYRVKAYDSYSAASGYRTSDTRTVINNTAPTITGGGALGEQNEPFAFTYSVADMDGNSLTVTEKLDGKTTKTRTGISGDSSLTFEQGHTEDGFRRILNGTHTITVEVSDGELGTSTSATFSKAVYAASVTLTAPLAVEGDITMAVIVVTGSIPADAVFKVEATNNGADPEPVWQDVTTEVLKGLNILFTNKTAAQGAAFNFRVAVSRGPSGEGGYIEAVSGAFQ